MTPPEQTRFLGALKGDALAQAYQNSSVLVLPSVEDGFGLVLGEALSFGLPVITTVNSGGADLFQDGREGFTVPIRDPRAIAEKLQLLADDPSRYEAMSAAAQICAKNLGGWETSDRLLVETLTSIAKKGRCGTN
jgi:glycosyltransferase involved in cell wall biosynthesis